MTLRGIAVDSGPRLAMGCDGGTIPKRHELVKGPKKVEKVSDRARWGLGAPRERGAVGWGQRVSRRRGARNPSESSA